MDELLSTAASTSTVHSSLAQDPRAKKDVLDQSERDTTGLSSASEFSTRKRAGAAADGFGAGVNFAPVRAVANPYPKYTLTPRYAYQPRYTSPFANKLSKKLFPRKFSRTRWSRARLLSGVVLFVVACFFFGHFRHGKTRLNKHTERFPGHDTSLHGDGADHDERDLHVSQRLRGNRKAHGAEVRDADSRKSKDGRQSSLKERSSSILIREDHTNSKTPQVGLSALTNDGMVQKPVHSAEVRSIRASRLASGSEFSQLAVPRRHAPSDVVNSKRGATPDENDAHDSSRLKDHNRLPGEASENENDVDASEQDDLKGEDLDELSNSTHAADEVHGPRSTETKSPKRGQRNDSPLGKPLAHHASRTAGTPSKKIHAGDYEDPWVEYSGAHGPYVASHESIGGTPPAVELWSHRDIVTSRNYKFPFCRIYGACRTKSGRILISKSLESHRNALARCGVLSHDNFVLGDEDKMKSFAFEDSLPDGAQFRHMDLVERHAPRRGAAHFFADSLKTLFFLDAVYGSGAKGSNTLQRVCLQASGNQANGSCDAQTASPGVNPVMFIRKESFSDDIWVPSYLRLLASSGSVRGNAPFRYLNIYGIYPKWKPGTPEPAACFKSITTSSYLYGQIPPSSLTAANPFFSGNGIDRVRRSVFVHETNTKNAPRVRTAARPVFRECRVRVKISDQLEQGLADQVSALTHALREKTETLQPEHMQMSIVLVVPQGGPVDFKTQMGRIQETDVLVAPHGSQLSDIVFLRTGAAVVEIHPFGYVSGMFQGITRQLGVRHTKLSAKPDVTAFEACIRHANNPTESDELDALIAKVKKGAGEYVQTGHSSVQLEDGSQEHRSVKDIKLCARQQPLNLDGSKLASAIWSRAQEACTTEASVWSVTQ